MTKSSGAVVTESNDLAARCQRTGGKTTTKSQERGYQPRQYDVEFA